MYRASEKTKQTDMWKDPRLEMGKRSREIFEDDKGWHHQFRREVTNRVDEDIFKPLFSDGKGAPNAPIRILVAMMALKEAQGISDEYLYEQARFNALVRSALGLFDRDEEAPTESTYYLFRQRIVEYEEKNGKNLLEEVFEQITKGQCTEYQVSGKRVRMDSKLLGSNIAWYGRYGVVHETIRTYCAANGITGEEGSELAVILKEKAETVVYRNTKEEVEHRLKELGTVLYRLLGDNGAEGNKEYHLLKRVFEEQYEIVSGPGGGNEKQVKARENKEIRSKSVQNPHDEDSEYRKKGEQKVQGYSINVTETCDEGEVDERPLNLIVGIQTAGCAQADLDFLQEGLEGAQAVVVDKIEEVYTDGAFHSPDNQEYCKKEGIDLVLGGISGPEPKYDVSFDDEGNMIVINTESGERIEAKKAKSRDPQGPERWGIKDGDKALRYFTEKDVETSELRKRLAGIPKERRNIRNNVEATIFQVGYHYRGDKSRYRGQPEHKMWAVGRCLWVNFRRIQLWIQRKAGNGETGGAGITKAYSFFKFFRKIFWLPEFAGSC